MSVLQNQSGTVPATTTGGPSTPISIVSSTDTTPIHVVVTPAQAWALDGETVRVEGHQTNTNANGLWQALIVSSTEIVLVGSTGTGAGAGGATGVVYDYNTTPAAAMPNNGDLATGPSVATAVTAPLNGMPFILERTGALRVYNLLTFGTTRALPTTVWSSNPSVPSGGTATLMATTSDVLLGEYGKPLTVYKGDIVHVKYRVSYVLTPGTSLGNLVALWLGANVSGAGYNHVGQRVHLAQNIADTSGAADYSGTVMLEDYLLNPTGPAVGSQSAGITYDFCLFVSNYDASTTAAINLVGDAMISVEQLRGNG
jgi:hypothetical protein